MDATTFDIADMFSGASMPKADVEVYTNAGLAQEIHKTNQEISRAVTDNASEDELKALQGKAEELYRKAQSCRYVFHLTGVRRELQINLLRDIEEKYPVQTDFLGREKFNIERSEYEQNATWALYIERIEAPNGAVRVSPTVEEVALIRGNLPAPEITKVSAAINSLTDDVSKGIEAIAAEHDFLSRR